MTEQNKKFMKLLYILVPVLLIAGWYGYSQMKAVTDRKAARREKVKQAMNEPVTSAAPSVNQDTPGEPHRAPAEAPVLAQAAGPAPAKAADGPSLSGLIARADAAAQSKRTKLPWGRDPFVLPQMQAKTPEVKPQSEEASVKPVLRGISWSTQGGVALINDEVVAENEQICGYQVAKITRDSVLLKRDGRELLLKIKE